MRAVFLVIALTVFAQGLATVTPAPVAELESQARSAGYFVPCDSDLDCVKKNGGDPERVLD